MEPTSIAQVVGANLAEIRTRHNLTTDQIAKAVKLYGLRWSDSRVSAMERGRIPATLPTLFALAQALGDVSGIRISIAELARFDGWVEINPELTVSGSALTTALNGSKLDLTSGEIFGELEGLVGSIREANQAPPLNLPEELRVLPPGRLRKVQKDSGITEGRVAKSLGIDEDHLARLSLALWGSSFSAERDRRAGPDTNAQAKGRISRALKDELIARVGHGDH